MDNMKTQDKDVAEAEALAHQAAKKLFDTISTLVFPSEHSLELSMLAKEAIVTAYREGLEHAYKACFQIVKDETGKCQ
jgi:collagenase-like PrtC family protease